MKRTNAARAVIAGIALSALGLVAASPASAAEVRLYGYYFNFEGNPETDQGIATIGSTDALVTPLPPVAHPLAIFSALGQDIVGGVGYVMGVSPELGVSLTTFDPATGTTSAQIEIDIDESDIVDGGRSIVYISGLDSLADGTLLVQIRYTETIVNAESTHYAIASVDPVSGLVVPVVNLDDVMEDEGEALYNGMDLATDPITGGTYLFAVSTTASLDSYFLPLDVAAHSHGAVTPFTGADFGEGAMYGADFAADGTLYFNYGNFIEEQLQLSTVGSPSGWADAPRTTVAGYQIVGGTGVQEEALAVDDSAAPALAATGIDLTLPLTGAAALGLLGMMLLLVRSRSRLRSTTGS